VRRASHPTGEEGERCALMDGWHLQSRNSTRDVGSTLTPIQINEMAANLQLREGLPAFLQRDREMKPPASRLLPPFSRYCPRHVWRRTIFPKKDGPLR
jgi:hypothetical protein